MARKTNCTVNGAPKYRYRPIDPDCDKANFYGDSKKDAIKKYEDYMVKKKQLNSRVFKDFFSDWLDVEKKPMLKQASYNRYLSLKTNWIDHAPFCKMPLKTIDSLTIKKFLNEVEAKGSSYTANAVYNLLSSFFKYSTDYHIDKNPMARVSEPKYVQKKVKDFLTLEEITLIESKLTAPEEFVYIFALYTGLREGEISALRVNDVDLKRKTVKVTKTLNRVKINGKNQILEGSPKSKSSEREVPIKDSLIPLLTTHIFNEKTKYTKFGISYGPDSYFFTTTTVRPLRGDRVNDAWKKVQAKFGLEPIKFHALRHTYCTLLARAGVRLEVASKLMGHNSIQTTANVYIHVASEDKKEAIEAVNSLFSTKVSSE